jgi:hypothetical protein
MRLRKSRGLRRLLLRSRKAEYCDQVIRIRLLMIDDTHTHTHTQRERERWIQVDVMVDGCLCAVNTSARCECKTTRLMLLMMKMEGGKENLPAMSLPRDSRLTYRSIRSRTAKYFLQLDLFETSKFITLAASACTFVACCLFCCFPLLLLLLLLLLLSFITFISNINTSTIDAQFENLEANRCYTTFW